jgi:hypothetical protein
MDLTVSIPKELEPVVPYLEKLWGQSLTDWATEKLVGNLTSVANAEYKVDVVEKTTTVDDRVKAVDWTEKTAAMSVAEEGIIVEPVEGIEVIEKP